jgi:hypothetical protein
MRPSPCGSYRVRLDQARQQRVAFLRLRFAAEAACGFEQAGADALGQFPRGGLGERHHQDLRRHPRLEGSVFRAVRACVAEHQAHVQRRDRPGLAGAGAGFDQAAAPEGEAQDVEGGHGRCLRAWR